MEGDMSISAPPGPSDSTETGHDDIFEALIEEARQRARRRRRLYGVAASVAVIAVIAGIVGFNGAGSSPADRAAVDAAAGSPAGDLGVFEPMRGWIAFSDGAGGIGAVDPNNPSSRRTVLANPEGITDDVRPTGWSTDGTQLELEGVGMKDPAGGGSWIMDSTGSLHDLNNVEPLSGRFTGLDNTVAPVGLGLRLGETALWRLSDGSTYLIPYLVAKWITVESDPTRKWEIAFIVWYAALSADGQQLLLTAAPGPGETERNWGFEDLATAPGLYVLRAYPDGGLDGNSLRRIAAGPYLAAEWSPDGTQIAAISATPECCELVVMNADGTDKHAARGRAQ